MGEKLEGICLSSANLKNLLFVLDYLIESEERSYEEYIFDLYEGELLKEEHDNYDFVLDKEFYNRTGVEHIYAFARRAKDALVCRP